MDFKALVAGLTRIGVAMRQAPDKATFDVYHPCFEQDMDGPTWDRFTQWAIEFHPWVEESRYRRFPSVPELKEAVRLFRGDRPMLAEATEAYERVLGCGTYSPQGGTTWSYRAVKERCGEAAAMAFLAAGGTAAFETTWDESKRRERFVAEYAESVRESPNAALLPEGVKALPPAEPNRALTQAEAVEIMRGIEERAPKVKRRFVQITPERAAELERQKAQILEEPNDVA